MKLSVELTDKQWSYVIQTLGRQPFNEVFELIMSIDGQIRNKIEEANNDAENT